MARDKTILYLGLAGAAVAGAVLIAQGPKKKGKVIPAAPKPQGVQEKLGELKAMRAAIQANADKLSVADWLELEEPFNAYMDEVLVYMLMIAHHVAADSTSSIRGPNGHVLSDAEAREQAFASLPNFRHDDYIETVNPSLVGELAGGARPGRDDVDVPKPCRGVRAPCAGRPCEASLSGCSSRCSRTTSRRAES